MLLNIGLTVLSYAILRYHIIKNVPWEHLPIYTTNKVFAVVGLVVWSASASPQIANVANVTALLDFGAPQCTC